MGDEQGWNGRDQDSSRNHCGGVIFCKLIDEALGGGLLGLGFFHQMDDPGQCAIRGEVSHLYL